MPLKVSPKLLVLQLLHAMSGISEMTFVHYGGFTSDFGKAAAITSTATIVCIGVGLILSGAGAPLGVTFLVGVATGVATSYGSDWLKKTT